MAPKNWKVKLFEALPPEKARRTVGGAADPVDTFAVMATGPDQAKKEAKRWLAGKGYTTLRSVNVSGTDKNTLIIYASAGSKVAASAAMAARAAKGTKK